MEASESEKSGIDPAEEEAAAAAEAAAIGGEVDYDIQDESQRPLVEAGQGEAEGFELAEADLVDAASHGNSSVDPMEHVSVESDEALRATIEYGEADEVDSMQVTSDPDEGAGHSR